MLYIGNIKAMLSLWKTKVIKFTQKVLDKDIYMKN